MPARRKTTRPYVCDTRKVREPARLRPGTHRRRLDPTALFARYRKLANDKPCCEKKCVSKLSISRIQEIRQQTCSLTQKEEKEQVVQKLLSFMPEKKLPPKYQLDGISVCRTAFMFAHGYGEHVMAGALAMAKEGQMIFVHQARGRVRSLKRDWAVGWLDMFLKNHGDEQVCMH